MPSTACRSSATPWRRQDATIPSSSLIAGPLAGAPSGPGCSIASSADTDCTGGTRIGPVPTRFTQITRIGNTNKEKECVLTGDTASLLVLSVLSVSSVVLLVLFFLAGVIPHSYRRMRLYRLFPWY